MTSMWGNQIDFNTLTGRKISFLIIVHAQNKMVELSDTIFMVLRGKAKQVTKLHLWHHLLLLWSWYLVVRFGCGGDAYFGRLVVVVVVLFCERFTASRLKRRLQRRETREEK